MSQKIYCFLQRKSLGRFNFLVFLYLSNYFWLMIKASHSFINNLNDILQIFPRFRLFVLARQLWTKTRKYQKVSNLFKSFKFCLSSSQRLYQNITYKWFWQFESYINHKTLTFSAFSSFRIDFMAHSENLETPEIFKPLKGNVFSFSSFQRL